MKQLIGLIALVFTFTVAGELDMAWRMSGDFSRGWNAGFRAGLAAHQPTSEDKVVGNLLCHYADLACGKRK